MTTPDFHLETERLIIRNWQDGDEEVFYRINSDDAIMKFFPYKRTREESSAFFSKNKLHISRNGYGYTAIALKDTNESIGFCGLHYCNAQPAMPSDIMEIGWRLLPEYWGNGYITEAAKRLTQFGFETLQLPEIFSFAVSANKKSFAVMKRLGMKRVKAMDFDHPRVPDTHPRLKRHLVYKLTNPDFGKENKKGRMNRPLEMIFKQPS